MEGRIRINKVNQSWRYKNLSNSQFYVNNMTRNLKLLAYITNLNWTCHGYYADIIIWTRLIMLSSV